MRGEAGVSAPAPPLPQLPFREAVMAAFTDKTGQRFGQLVVLRQTPERDRWGRIWWECLCDCGQLCIVQGKRMQSGHTRSCGCRQGGYRHGHGRGRGQRHPLFEMWLGMIKRCHRPYNTGFKYYGGRGIAVCERWHDFPAFLADVGERPSPELTLDRINNDGNYEPGNVRWATRKQQAANQRPRRKRE